MKIILVGAGLVLACFVMMHGEGPSREICEVRLKNCFQDTREALMRTWGVVDIMRSITIAPVFRIRFIQRVVDDVITMLSSVSTLACCCEWCSGCHCRVEDDFVDLSSRLGCLNEAFEAVCAEKKCGEENIIGRLIERTQQQLRDCWALFYKGSTPALEGGANT